MRNTQKVSMWPVGLCTKTGLSTPIVKDGQFIGFYDGWIAGRKFPVDMAGFAVSVKFLQEVNIYSLIKYTFYYLKYTNLKFELLQRLKYSKYV